MIFASPSSLNNYKQCPYKYYWSNVLKNKGEQSKDMILGSSVHSVLQVHGQKIMTNGGELFKEDIKKFLTQEHIPSMLLSDSNIVQKWMNIFNFIYEHYDDIFNKYTFSLENFIDKIYIKDGVFATGKYDRLDNYNDEGRIVCVDYKTGNAEEKNFEFDFQYLIYSKYLINRFREEKKREIRIIGFKNGYKTFTKEASDSNWQIILDWVGKIENDKTYEPCQGNLCNWCEAQKSCPLFGGKDVRENMKTKSSTVQPVVAPNIVPQKESRFKVKQIIEKDACPQCNKMIPIDSWKCPECGVEFEIGQRTI